MSISGGFLKIQPSELKMPFELKRQSSCSMQLTNKTDYHIAFKVKTTNPRKYCVKPNAGIILPRSSCVVTITMQAPRQLLTDLQCKDKFLIQSVVTDDGVSVKDINSAMFKKGAGKIVEEFKLRVVYITANPPSPVPEGDEETSSTTSTEEREDENSSSMNSVSTTLWKLAKEKADVTEENKKLQDQLELLMKQRRKHGARFSVVFVTLVTLLSIAVGLLFKTIS